MRVDDALIVSETIFSKYNEFKLQLGIASLDIKHGFDGVSRAYIFDALCAQGTKEPMIALLVELYFRRAGGTSGSNTLPLRRGVRQGDVISSVLFNAVLEHAFRTWMTTRQ